VKPLLALLALAAAPAPPPAAPCLSGAQAQAVALVALPEIIRETGTVCAARLPASALVRQTGGPLLARYDAEADRAWPTVREAIARLTDASAAVLLQSDYARPLLVHLVVPQLVGRIEPADCATVERMVTLLSPLPPRNIAGLVVTALAHLKAEKARGKPVDVPDLPLCPDAGR
jgi:hypothetical protein